MIEPPFAHRPYVEALPRFHIVTLDAQVKRGAGAIRWYDEHDAFVGAATITMTGRLSMALSYVTDAIGYVAFSRGAVEFALRRRTRSGVDDRPAVICPDCDRAKDVMLLLDDEWKCSKCHDVKNLTTMIDSSTRKHIELQELSNVVERKRQRYMRNEQYNKMVDRHATLIREIGGETPRTLAAHHLYRVTESYYRADQMADLRKRSPGPRHVRKARG